MQLTIDKPLFSQLSPGKDQQMKSLASSQMNIRSFEYL